MRPVQGEWVSIPDPVVADARVVGVVAAIGQVHGELQARVTDRRGPGYTWSAWVAFEDVRPAPLGTGGRQLGLLT